MKKLLTLITVFALLLLTLAACTNGNEESSLPEVESSESEQSNAESKPWYDTSVPEGYSSQPPEQSQPEASQDIDESSQVVDESSQPEQNNENELGEGIIAIPDKSASGYRIAFTKENPINAVDCNTNVHIAVTAIYDGSVTRFFGAVKGEFYCAKPGKYLYACCDGFCAGDKEKIGGESYLEFKFDKDSGAFVSAEELPHGHGSYGSYTVYQPSVQKVYGYQYGESEMLYLYEPGGTVICRELKSDYDLETNWKNGTMNFPEESLGKYGLIYDGKVVVPFEYDYMAVYRSMSDLTYGNGVGVVLAEKDGRSYYFSNNGTNLTPDGFDCGSQPFADRAWVFEDGYGWIIEFN